MTVNPRHSFKLKLCLWIFGVSLLTYLLIFSAGIWFSYNEVRTGVSNTVTSRLEYAARALDEGLSCTEVSSDNLVSVMNSPLFKFDDKTIFECCEHFLKANPRIQGVAIGYEPGVVPGHPEGFSPYIMRSADCFIKRDLAKIKDYRSHDWYKTSFDAGEPQWSKPFRESNGTIITSYNVPIRNAQGCIIGICAVDLNLNVISDSLQVLSPYEGASLCIVDQDGHYVAHADRNLILTLAPQEVLDFIKSADEYMSEGSGREEMYIFRTKEPKTGWAILLSIPRSAMTARTGKMLNGMFIDMIIGMLLLIVVCLVVINKLTKPLVSFAEAARNIAHGHFDVDLPVIKDQNELYDLRQALCSMNVSLNSYIERLEETSSSKAAMERELSIARNIQMAMVPKLFPPFPERDNVDIFASLTPAQAVGGDLYDFVLHDDILYFCIGDVSGKGVPASLLMAVTRSLFRNCAAAGYTPSRIAALLNDSIADTNDMSMFVTMFVVSFDLVTGKLTVCNCGHNMPVTNCVIADPSTMKVATIDKYRYMSNIPTNIALGVMPGFKFVEVSMQIEPGAMILLYTDGITEAENNMKDLYGEHRLTALMNSLGADASSETIIKSIVADVKSFAADAAQSDDITALCIRCKRIGA